MALHLKARLARREIFKPVGITTSICEIANILLAQPECSHLDIRSYRRAYQLGLCDAAAAWWSDYRYKPTPAEILETTDIAFGLGTINDTDPLLRAAAVVGNNQIVQRILLTISDTEPVVNDIERALKSAAMLGHETTVCLLVEWFKKSRYADSVPFKPALEKALLQASANGHVAIVNVLFSSFGQPLPSVDTTIIDSLNASICGNHDQVVQWVLKTWRSSISHSHLNTSLLVACRYSAISIVKLLLDYGADPKARSYDGQTCLQQATRSGSLRTVCLLLDRGVQCEDEANGDLLSVAAQYGYQDILQYLISLGCNIHDYFYGSSSLAAAARNGELSIVRFLIDKGAGLEAPHVGGKALENAAEWGHVDIVRLLVEQGVPVIGTKPGNNPMLLALMYDQRDVVDTLLQLGADKVDPLESDIGHLFEEGIFPQKR